MCCLHTYKLNYVQQEFVKDIYITRIIVISENELTLYRITWLVY